MENKKDSCVDFSGEKKRRIREAEKTGRERGDRSVDSGSSRATGGGSCVGGTQNWPKRVEVGSLPAFFLLSPPEADVNIQKIMSL